MCSTLIPVPFTFVLDRNPPTGDVIFSGPADMDDVLSQVELLDLGVFERKDEWDMAFPFGVLLHYEIVNQSQATHGGRSHRGPEKHFLLVLVQR